jgi:hypothetical protein
MTGEKIKKELYCAIREIGKQKIQKDITLSIQSSQKYIDLLMNKCIGGLISAELSSDHDRLIGTLSEAVIHFMLTISTLPSERKIRLNGELVIDVVIPSLRNLKANPSNFKVDYRTIHKARTGIKQSIKTPIHTTQQ